MQPNSAFLATSVASSLLTRFSRTHERRGITVVAGHPGVGKSRTIRQFRELNSRRVAVISLGEGPKGGHSATQALGFALRAVQDITNFFTHPRSNDHLSLRDMLVSGLIHWTGEHPNSFGPGGLDAFAIPTCTVVFDEAQHLSRSGIEALRGLNDTPDEGGFAPFKVGLIFVGNQEFALKARGGEPERSDASRLRSRDVLDHVGLLGRKGRRSCSLPTVRWTSIWAQSSSHFATSSQATSTAASAAPTDCLSACAPRSAPAPSPPPPCAMCWR